ncbi:HIRAN domain-containing protein [Pseudomonadota bacterium]
MSINECILAGCQYYRAEGVWTFLRVGEALRLKREPHNQHDPNAIAVYFKNDMLGFIPSNENELLAQLMDQGEPLEAFITQLLSDSKVGRNVRFGVFSGSKSRICTANTLHMSWK